MALKPRYPLMLVPLAISLLRTAASSAVPAAALTVGEHNDTVVSMVIYTNAACTPSSKIEEVAFVQDGRDPMCWAMLDNSSSWGFTAVCEANSVGIHAFEERDCTGTPLRFVGGVTGKRAVDFFAATGCEIFQPELNTPPRFGKLSVALPAGSYPACVADAEMDRPGSPALSGAAPKALHLIVVLGAVSAIVARWA